MNYSHPLLSIFWYFIIILQIRVYDIRDGGGYKLLHQLDAGKFIEKKLAKRKEAINTAGWLVISILCHFQLDVKQILTKKYSFPRFFIQFCMGVYWSIVGCLKSFEGNPPAWPIIHVLLSNLVCLCSSSVQWWCQKILWFG